MERILCLLFIALIVALCLSPSAKKRRRYPSCEGCPMLMEEGSQVDGDKVL